MRFVCLKCPQVQAGSSGNETWVGGVDKEKLCWEKTQLEHIHWYSLFMHVGDIIHVQNKEVEPSQDSV